MVFRQPVCTAVGLMLMKLKEDRAFWQNCSRDYFDNSLDVFTGSYEADGVFYTLRSESIRGKEFLVCIVEPVAHLKDKELFTYHRDRAPLAFNCGVDPYDALKAALNNAYRLRREVEKEEADEEEDKSKISLFFFMVSVMTIAKKKKTEQENKHIEDAENKQTLLIYVFQR